MKEGNSFSQKTHSHPTILDFTWCFLSSNNIHKAKKNTLIWKVIKVEAFSVFRHISIQILVCNLCKIFLKTNLKMINFTLTILWWYSHLRSCKGRKYSHRKFEFVYQRLSFKRSVLAAEQTWYRRRSGVV